MEMLQHAEPHTIIEWKLKINSTMKDHLCVAINYTHKIVLHRYLNKGRYLTLQHQEFN